MTTPELKQFIINHVSETGRFPRLALLSQTMKVPEYKVTIALRALRTEGFLAMNGNLYVLNAPIDVTPEEVRAHLHTPEIEAPKMPSEQSAGITPTPAHSSHSQPVLVPSRTKEKGKVDWTIPLIKWIMAVISLAAAFMSAYYSSIWLQEGNPNWVAYVLAGVAIAFGLVAFEAVILFMQKWKTNRVKNAKGHHHGGKEYFWAGIGFVLLWVVLTGFSITSTIAGQYNIRVKMESQIADNRTDHEKFMVQARAEYGVKLAAKSELEEQRTAKKGRLKPYQDLLNSMATVDSRVAHDKEWTYAQNNSAQLEKEIGELSTKIELKATELTNMTKANPELLDATGAVSKETPDFYTWVAGVLKVGRDMAQFIMGLFLPVFLDIIAPAAMAVALFLRRKD